MGGKIQKKRQEKKKGRDEKKLSKVSEMNNKSSDERRLNRRGPRLAPSLRKEIDRMNGTNGFENYEGNDSDAGETFTGDVYEYEEVIPEEESKKNRRYDTVDNYEYELPDHFKVRVVILVHRLFFWVLFCFLEIWLFILRWSNESYVFF